MKTLIVSGYADDRSLDSPYWQRWMETQLDNAMRIEYAHPQTLSLSAYADRLLQVLNRANEPIWIIAHSIGCIATILAGLSHSSKVAGTILVAPTIAPYSPPNQPDAIRADTIDINVDETILNCSLPFPSVVIASENDPRTKLMTAAYWAHAWGSHFISIGRAGHIDEHSGYGPWPWGLALYHRFSALYDIQSFEQKPNTNPDQKITQIIRGIKTFSLQHGLVPFAETSMY